MVDSRLFDQAAGIWQGSKHILILTHEKPDGDAIASLLAARYIFEHVTKAKTLCVCRDGVPAAFRFLPESDLVHKDFLGGDIDLIVILDCGDLRRTGFADRISALSRKGTPIINIDHHPKNDLHRLATLNVVDVEAAATTQILYALCEYAHLSYSAVLATYIFTGLYTDTGSFQHPVTTPAVLEIAATMLARGARMKEVHNNLLNARSIPMLRLWGIALERVRLTGLGIVTSVITQKDLQRTGASEEDLSGIVSMLEGAHNGRLALLLIELEGGHIKGSLRSNASKIDVAKLARLFGGGGHARAAGFTIPGTIRMDRKGWYIV